MSLVEREHLLDQLDAIFTGSVAGNGHVVHVGGPGASGKTALVRAFGERAAAGGALVLTATCSRAERGVNGGVLAQFAAGLPVEVTERLGRLLDVERVGAPTTAAQESTTPDTGAQQHSQTVRAVREVLFDAAKAQPLVLVADDVEYADSCTLQALLHLQRRLSGARIMLVLTESDHSRHVNALFRAELTRTPWFTPVRLSPLSPRGVARIVAEELDQRTATALAPAYHAMTGGNPLLVKALVQDHRTAVFTEDGDPGDGVTAGEAFRQAVLACLHRWEPGMLDVVRAVAVLGENATPELLGRLLGRKTASVVEVLTALNHTGLLDDGRFRHPAVRAAVLADLGVDELAAAHQRAAGLLYAEGLPSADIAAHLSAAGAATAPWAVAVLRDAADTALAEHRPERAVEFLKLARASCPEDDAAGRAALAAALAAVQWRATPSVVSRHLPELREAAERGLLGVRETRALLRYQLWFGRTAEARDTLRRLEETAAESPHSPAASEHRVLRDWVRWLHPTVADAVPVGAGDRRSALVRDHQEDLVATAERLLRNCWAPDSAPEGASYALLTLAACGEVGRAKHWCDTLRGDVGTGNAATWKAVLADVRAHIALMEGDLATAERQARLALTALSSHNWGPAIASPLAALVLATSATGKHDEAEAQLKRAVPVAAQNTWHWAVYLRARGQANLAAGRAHAALADFEACGELAVHWDLDLPALLPWRSDLAQAYLRLNRIDRAGELVLAQLERPTADNPRVRGVSLRVLSSSIELKQRLPMLREAAALFQGCGDQVELSVALALLSSTHHALGEFGAAKVVAKRALRMAEGCQAESLCRQFLPRGLVLDEAEGEEEEAAEVDSRGAAHEPDDLATLSTAERRVAALAALGHTNREISRKLYITVSTVEQHLTRVYRKLKVRRRTDLPTGLPMGALDMWAAEAPTVTAPQPTPGHPTGHATGHTPVQRSARDPRQGARSTSGGVIRR
ncbi:LuxR family transcriptional regulator [Saccharothrix xinjiangensis]|uniref:LuxR family transcriptional regulator n=1 Tax=Saccharothrix xinjiangensis TaxID=204798 RepID=A0ABV9XU65_9PSEU